MASKRMYDYILDYHKEVCPDQFAVLLRHSDLLPTIFRIVDARRRYRRKAYWKIEIERLPSNIVHAYDARSVYVQRGKNGRKFLFGSKPTGCFRVWLDREQNLVIHAIRTQVNSKQSLEYACGSEESLIYLYKLLQQFRKKQRTSFRAANGMFRFAWDFDKQDVYYATYPVERILNSQGFVSLPVQQQLESDLQFYFDNLDRFRQYGLSGIRKVLVCGPPGTGKTTAVLRLLASLRTQFVTGVIGVDGEVAIATIKKLAERNRPFVLFLDELDALKGQAPGFLLNFLDGADSPRTPKGCYLVFSTNYPQKIDPRILQRPGRIDRVFSMGLLSGQDASLVLRARMPESEKWDLLEIAKTLDQTTPAFVAEIANTAYSLAVSDGQDVSLEHVRQARQVLADSIQSAIDQANQGQMLDSERNFRENGPSPTLELLKEMKAGQTQTGPN